MLINDKLLNFLENNFTDCNELQADGIYTKHITDDINVEVDIKKENLYVYNIPTDDCLVMEKLISTEQIKKHINKYK